VVDFKNTIIIMTTNIGAETIVQSDDMTSPLLKYRAKNEEVSYQEMQKKLRARMEKEFRPEFLNRLDDIIVFRSLTRENLKQIVDMELAKVSKRVKEKGFTLVVSDEAKDFLIEKGSSVEFGARPLRRAVEQHLEDTMSEALLRGDFAGKDTITIGVTGEGDDKKLTFEATTTAPAPAPEQPAAAASGGQE
jgi:ATP-dependent Clp protease ATP-binding subunit ClpC